MGHFGIVLISSWLQRKRVGVASRAMRTLAVAFLLIGCGQPAGSGTDANGGDGPHQGSGTVDSSVSGSSGITIIVTPNANHESELSTAIAAATQSVYMTMYEIDDATVLSALVARKQAGLDVQAIIDGSTTTKTFNTAAYNQLMTAHVDIVWRARRSRTRTRSA